MDPEGGAQRWRPGKRTEKKPTLPSTGAAPLAAGLGCVAMMVITVVLFAIGAICNLVS